QIRTEIAKERAKWEAQIQHAESSASRQQDQLRQRIADERQRLQSDQQRRVGEILRERADLLRQQALITDGNAEQVRTAAELTAVLRRKRSDLSFRKYVSFIMRGD
ncbi:hypothetical protein G3I76_68335, partial [Streptomyces sp. SID11233]|nr:hypothetical protein [Streptomyces sp. SID11233]